MLPGSTIKGISDEAMEVYRRRYAEPGESRRPTLSWPREIPIDGEPPDVVALVAEYAKWLSQSQAHKLFVNAEPGAILTGPQREFCRSFPNQREVTVPTSGVHFIQEDSPYLGPCPRNRGGLDRGVVRGIVNQLHWVQVTFSRSNNA